MSSFLRTHFASAFALLILSCHFKALFGLPIPIPFPGDGSGSGGGIGGIGACTRDQFLSEADAALKSLRARPLRYGIMAYALKRTIDQLENDSNFLGASTLTILTPTNRAVARAGITPATLSALANDRIGDTLKVNLLIGHFTFDELRAMPEGTEMDTANSNVKVARYEDRDGVVARGTDVAIGVVGTGSRRWAEILDKELYRGSCLVLHGTARVLRP